MVKKSNHQLNSVNLVAATVFAIVALVHAFRLGNGWPVVIGTWSAPMWLSWLGILLAGSLATLLWKNA